MIIESSQNIRKIILKHINTCFTYNDLHRLLCKKFSNQNLNGVYNLNGKLIGVKLNNICYTYSDKELNY